LARRFYSLKDGGYAKMPNSGDAVSFRFGGRSSFRKWQWPLLWGLALPLTVWIVFLGWNWPFTRKAVVTALERESSRVVRIGSFHGTLFPPGYVAESLIFRKPLAAKEDEDVATVRKMTVIARWPDLLLLRKRVERVSIDGLRMLPPQANRNALPVTTSPGSPKSVK